MLMLSLGNCFGFIGTLGLVAKPGRTICGSMISAAVPTNVFIPAIGSRTVAQIFLLLIATTELVIAGTRALLGGQSVRKKLRAGFC